jgi:hypothetical protein
MRSLLVFLVVGLSVCAQAQIEVKDLLELGGSVLSNAAAKKEKSDLQGALQKWNAEQRGHNFQGATIEVRVSEGSRGYWRGEQGQWLRSRVMQELTAIGAVPVWDRAEIERESRDLEALSSNRWVRQESLPQHGSVEVGGFILELELRQLEKNQDISAWFGSWWRGGFSGNLSRETVMIGLTAMLRERSGGVGAVYRSAGTASTADNMSAEFSRLFGSQTGFRVREEDRDGRRFRALEGAIRDMGRVLRSKNSTRGNGR